MKAEKYPYRSQHCAIGNHGNCKRVYGRLQTECTCTCGHGAPVQTDLFVPPAMPSRARVFDPAPLLASVWLGTDCLAVTG